MITVANFSDLTEATLLRSWLEAEGIPAFIPDEFTAQNDWLITTVGGIRVQVPDQFEEKAIPLVDEFLDESEEPPCCEVPDLEEKLKQLGPLQRAAFAAACCERLLPNYSVFQEQENWGNTSVLRNALDRIWECLEKGARPQNNLPHLISECEALIPNPDDFENPLLSAALHAGAALVGTLECYRSGGLEPAIQVATCALDTVDMALIDQGLDDPEIETHPWIKREIARQEADLKTLSQSAPTPALLHQLRHSWKTENHGRSNIDLPSTSPAA